MKIIVGLGNPDKEYDKTNHNVGFMVLDKVCASLNKKFGKNYCDSLIAEANIKGEKIVFAKPLTYMNNSGKAVKGLMKKFSAESPTLLVLADDYDVQAGTIRLKQSVSSTTHNGIKSIISELGNKEFNRVKISIGKKPNSEMSTADFVLSKIKSPDTFKAIDKAADLVLDYVNGAEIDALMQKYN